MSMSAKTASKEAGGATILLILGILFSLFGGGFLGYSGYQCYQSTQMQKWQQTNAFILEARLQKNRGQKSTTYLAIAQYRYEINGKNFKGSRVGISSSADNLGSWQQDTYNELRHAMKEKQPVICYVNPENSYDAVLFPQIRMGLMGLKLLFGGVFFLAGVIMLFSSSGIRKSFVYSRKMQTLHPTEPWRWSSDYKDGISRSSNKKQVIVLGIFTFFFLAFSVPLGFAIFKTYQTNPKIWIAAIFPFVSLCMLIGFTYRLFQYIKYGESTLHMETFPGLTGQEFRAMIKTKKRLDLLKPATIHLNCIEVYTSGTGKNRSKKERVLWQDSRTITQQNCQHYAEQTAINVKFNIPFDAPPTALPEDPKRIYWKIECIAETTGIDYRGEFIVPVFQGKESNNRQIEETPESMDHSSPASLDGLKAACESEKLRFTQEADQSITIYSPKGRYATKAVGLLIFWIIWTSLVFALFLFKVPVFFAIAFGLVDLLIFAMLFDFLFGSIRLTLEKDRLIINSRGLIFGKTTELSPDQMMEISTDRDMQINSKLYYRICIQESERKKHVVLKRLSQIGSANVIVQFLKDKYTIN